MEKEDYEIIDAMSKYGGSFVVALAEAARCADPFNFMRLKATFRDYWEEYRSIAVSHGTTKRKR